MMTATQMPRIFLMNQKGNDITLTDPDAKWSTDAVLQFYANTYPILTTAKISGPVIIEDKVQYRFESMMGTKG